MRPQVIHRDIPEQPWTPTSNREFIQSLTESGDGEVKQASAGNTDYTRYILRESSFAPAIQPPKTITADDLIPSVDLTGGEVSELGFYLCEIEPGNPGARTVPIEASPNQNTYRGSRYAVPISKDMTDELYKTVDQLALYKMDLRQVMTDNLLKDMDNLPDFRLIQTVKDITGSTAGVNGQGGYLQYREVSGGIKRANYAQAFVPLMDAVLNNGVFLLSRQTHNAFLTWGRDEMGGDTAQDLILNGFNALDTVKWNGVPHIVSIKHTLLATGEVYHFAPSNFLGQFLEYQEPTIYVKKERETITVYAQRKYGMHIANVRAVARTYFN